MSDNWKDIFGSDQPEDSDEISKNLRSMSDEELDAYLNSLGITDDAGGSESENMELDSKSGKVDSDDDFSDTKVSDWLPKTGKIKGNDKPKITDDATSVIPADVKRISDITNKNERNNYRDEDNVNDEYDDMVVKRNKNKSGCMGGFMYFVFILAISIIIASLGWLAACDVFALNKKPMTATIEVPENFDIDEVISDLKKSGIIEYKFLFKLFTVIAHEKIEPGTYELKTEYDYRAIVSKMQDGVDSTEIAEVTIPEGKTLKQTFEILEEEGVCKAEKLWEAAANYDFEYEFLDSGTLGNQNRLEGYLFPDTYQFYKSSDPETVIKKFLNNFENRVTEEMYNQAEQMNLSINEVLTIASLIEMEAGSNDERATISSVIYNRLDSDYGKLEIDATVQYILEERKDKLSNEDTQIDNPYNTYVYRGLPPGPIANPGIASIVAALNPEDTNYWFYALNKSGTHEFFTINEKDEFEAFTNSDEYGG